MHAGKRVRHTIRVGATGPNDINPLVERCGRFSQSLRCPVREIRSVVSCATLGDTVEAGTRPAGGVVVKAQGASGQPTVTRTQLVVVPIVQRAVEEDDADSRFLCL